MKPTTLTAFLTLVVLFTGALVLIGYDIYAALRWGSQVTISWETWQISHQYPIIPLALGFVTGLLFGHLFWSQQP